MIYWLVMLGGLSYFLWLYFKPSRPTYRVEEPLGIAKIRLARGATTPQNMKTQSRISMKRDEDNIDTFITRAVSG